MAAKVMADNVLLNIEQYDAVSEIIPGLFLSSISPVYNAAILRQFAIKAVLSVLSDEPDFAQLDDIDYHFIEIDDDDGADLLSRFEHTNKLIGKWRKEGRNVLVHCFLGVSRSATLVTAFVMEHLQMTSAKAIDLVHQKRSVTSPNRSFREQLAIFGQLNYQLNIGDIWYRRYLFGRIVYEVADQLKNLTISLCIMKRFMPTGTVMKQIRALTETEVEDNCHQSYKCKNCRRLLFTDRQLLHCDQLNLFVHILPWMASERQYYLPFGKIYCPNCGCKLGRYRWLPQYPSIGRFQFGHIDQVTKRVTYELKVPMVFALAKSTVDTSSVAV